MGKGISALLAVLRRRGLPAVSTLAAVIGASVTYLAITPRFYASSAKLMIDHQGESVSKLAGNFTQLSTIARNNNTLADQAQLVKSQAVLAQAIEKLTSPTQVRSYAIQVKPQDISSSLKVSILPDTNILQLTYYHQNPQFAADVLNAVSQAMVEENIQALRSEATKVRQFLEKEVLGARNRLQQAEVAESTYKQKSGVIGDTNQTRTLVDSLTNLEAQERTLLAQLQAARSRDASLRQLTATENINSAYTSVRSGQDEQLKALRAKLIEIDTKLIEARLQFTDNHPKVTSLLGQRNQIKALYAQQVARVSPTNQTFPTADVASDQISQNLTTQLINNEIERVAIENKLRVVQSLRNNLQAQLAVLPLRQQPLTMLTRQREEAAVSLKSLQTKLEEARIAEAQKVNNLRIIELATVPTVHAYPQRSVVLIIAILCGSILASGVVLLLELMDNRLYEIAEAEELLKLPLLGVLPRIPATKLTLAPAEKFLNDISLVEPYRMLLKNLEFRSTDKLQVVVVSSTLSGEGKSVVVSHLGAVAAMLFRRTLIIDADLHRPVQHTLFNLPPQPGITDVINDNHTLLNAVQPTDIENLFVLTCGELHDRPSQLLESEAMKSLITEAAHHYDLVIIDTPPSSVSADTSTLSQYSDGVIMTTRPNVTLKESLQRAVSELNQNRIPILGVVVNGMNTDAEKYYRPAIDDHQSFLSKPLLKPKLLGGSSRNSEHN